jgi:hypothetical protein
MGLTIESGGDGQELLRHRPCFVWREDSRFTGWSDEHDAITQWFTQNAHHSAPVAGIRTRKAGCFRIPAVSSDRLRHDISN